MSDPTPPDSPTQITIRHLTGRPEYEACLELQRRTWGERFVECVPPALQMIGQKLGGVTAGAFAPPGRLVGFVFGLTGVQQRRLVHWSHMLAVVPELRDRGIGRRLKKFQWEVCRDQGVRTIYWTFDPLVARNAHFNLNRLGARIEEYVVNLYGEEPDNDLARGIGTDRFVVAWSVLDDPVERGSRPGSTVVERRFRDTPIVAPAAGGGRVTLQEAVTGRVRVEIPPDLTALLAGDGTEARRWRDSSREAFQTHLGAGFEVEGFYRETGSARCFYGLARAEES